MEHGFYDQQLASGFKEGGYLSEKSLSSGTSWTI